MDEQGGAQPATPLPFRLLRSPRTAVGAVVVLLVAASVAAWSAGLTGSPRPAAPHAPWWLLAGLFALAEVVVLHVQVRREAQAVSLSEIPLVLALFTATPRAMVLATVVGACVVYTLYRRQSPLKLAFNASLRLFGATTALVVFHGLAGPSAATAMDPGGWLAAIAAVAVAGAFDGLLVLGVVAIHEGRPERHEVATAVVRYPAISALVACFGVLVVAAVHSDVRTTPFILVAGAAITAAYRAHASLNDRHVSLATLYDFGRSVTGAHVADDILGSALESARTLLKAEAAEVVLLGDDPADLPRRWLLAPGSAQVRSDEVADGTHPALWHRVLLDGEAVLAPHGAGRTRDPQARAAAEQLAALGYRDAVVVALRDDTRILGTLMVAERMGEVRTFQASDVATVETLANQAGLALAKDKLLGRMQHEAQHDVLTGLPNRARFRDEAQSWLRRLQDGETPACAVLLVDLDGFKEVNDSLGHHHGDALLVHVATTMTSVMPASAIVARLGGDEFAVLLPDAPDPAAVTAMTDRLHRALAVPTTIEGIEIRVRASVGVALAPAHGTDVSSLLRAADLAMYRAKAGQEGTHLHEPANPQAQASPASAHTTRLALLADLRSAVAAGDLDVFVQPQADASDGRVIGVEALVRWQHPQRGLLPPADFLSVAERHGLMRDVTTLMLDKALDAAQGWRDEGLDLTVSVNLPARSLTDERTLVMVDAALAAHRVPPHRLTLEITEDSVIGDPAAAIALLERLRERGVRLSVDDFGTGYSSLSYLRRLPVDEVKIDRSFVAHLTHDTHDLLIARSIIDLGNNLGLDVVVEGVEDQDTWDHLAELGAHIIQGYHLARPMPADRLVEWLRAYMRSAHERPRLPRPRRQGAAAATAPGASR